MLSYLVQIEPVWNFDSDNSYEVSNQRSKIRKPFEISKAVFDLKLHVIIINDTFIKYCLSSKQRFKYSTYKLP